jgi:hypothetical protein
MRSDAQTGAIVRRLPVYSTHIGPEPMTYVDGLSCERSTPEIRARIVRQRCTRDPPIGAATRLGSENRPAHWCRDTAKSTHHMNA